LNGIKKYLLLRESNILIITIIFIIFLSVTQPAFTSRINIFGLLYAISVNSIIAGAMTVLIVSGGFDMSVGATLGFCGVAVALLLKSGAGIVASIIITIIIGCAIGLIIGFIVAYLKINPFITTLAAWFVIGSAMLILAGGRNISGLPNAFYLISDFKIFNIPMIIIFSIFSLFIFDFLLRKNVFFRQNYYIGDNEAAANLCGINVKKKKLFNYMITSGMAAIAGIFLTARFNSALNTAGEENAFEIITAVIIGGASLNGGSGTVIGSFLGLIFMALIRDTLVLFKVDLVWNKIAIGFILLIAVLADLLIQKKERI
jgi:ribose transport system permease protein